MAQRAFLTRSTTQMESEVCPFVFIISRSSDCPPDVNGRLNTPREIGWAITDIDVRPEPDWVANMVAQVQPLDEGERIVAVTGRTVFEQAHDLVSRLRSIEIAAKYRSRPRRTSLANGPCSMFERKALMAVGGFDPSGTTQKTWRSASD